MPTVEKAPQFSPPAETPEAVALRLAERIGARADALRKTTSESEERAYWLNLYAECLAAVKAAPPAPSGK